MDFTDITDEALERALDAALQAGDGPNALMFQRELNRRQRGGEKPTGKTNITQQGMSGFYEGAADILGAPVDLVATGYEAVTGREIDPVGGSQSLRDFLTKTTMIKEEQPQTAAQRIARGTGQVLGETAVAAPAIVAGGARAALGAGSSLYEAGKRAFKDVAEEAKAAPAAFAAAEGATALGGGLAESSVAELFPESPTAQMVANVLGAVVGGKTSEIGSRLLEKKPTGPLTAEELKSEAGRLYELQKSQGLSAQPDVTADIDREVFSYLDVSGYLTPIRGSNKVRVAPDYTKLKPVVNMLEAYADKGMTAANIQTIRRSIAGRMRDAKGEERNALRNVLRIFDENTAQLAPEIRVANGMYARAMKAEQVEELRELAANRATNANGDMENALRTEFRMLLRRIIKGQEQGWSREEVDQLKQIVEGGSAENMARFIGKFSPTGVVSLGVSAGLPYSAVYGATRDPALASAAAGGTMAAGFAGKQAGAALQQQNIDRLYQSIVQGRNMTPAAQMRLRAALTSYLAGQAAAQ